eukprot:21823-Pelagococcus_subviridis.AAC.1
MTRGARARRGREATRRVRDLNEVDTCRRKVKNDAWRFLTRRVARYTRRRETDDASRETQKNLGNGQRYSTRMPSMRIWSRA